MQNTQEHGEETVEGAIPKIDPENRSNLMEQTEKYNKSNANRSQLNEFEKTYESKGGALLEGSDFVLQKQDSINNLLDLVSRIFHKSSNVNVQRVGLIYLAQVLNYYPVLCPRYLDVLLTVEDDVRQAVLDINPENNGEFNIVLSTPPVNHRHELLQVQNGWCTSSLEFMRTG